MTIANYRPAPKKVIAVCVTLLVISLYISVGNRASFDWSFGVVAEDIRIKIQFIPAMIANGIIILWASMEIFRKYTNH